MQQFLNNKPNTPETFYEKKAILETLIRTYGSNYVAIFKDIALNENSLHVIRALALQYIERYAWPSEERTILAVAKTLATAQASFGSGSRNLYSPAAQMIGMDIISKYEFRGLYAFQKTNIGRDSLELLSNPAILYSYNIDELQAGFRALLRTDPVKAAECLKTIAGRYCLTEQELNGLLADTANILGITGLTLLNDIALLYGFATPTYENCVARMISLTAKETTSGQVSDSIQTLQTTALAQLSILSIMRYGRISNILNNLDRTNFPGLTTDTFRPSFVTGFISRAKPESVPTETIIREKALVLYSGTSPETNGFRKYLENIRSATPTLYTKNILAILYLNYIDCVTKTFSDPLNTDTHRAIEREALAQLNTALNNTGITLADLKRELISALRPLLFNEAKRSLGEWHTDSELYDLFVIPLLNFINMPLRDRYVRIYNTAYRLKQRQTTELLDIQYNRFFKLLTT